MRRDDSPFPFTIIIKIFVLVSLFLPNSNFAETIILKSGKTIEGKITEKTSEYIKIDFSGTPLTYYLEDIERIVDEELNSHSETKVSEKKCFLWEVKSDKNTIYILGSIHIAKRNLYPLEKNIEDAFAKADILVTEINLNEIDAFKSQQMALKHGVYQGGDTLRNNLSAKTYELVLKRSKKLLTPLEAGVIDVYKPWYIAFMLLQRQCKALGYEAEYGIDNYFSKKAKGEKTVLELESLEYQMDILNSLSQEEQELFLYYTLIELDILEHQMNEFTEAWLKGDIKKMESIMKEGLSEEPRLLSFYEKFFYQRNKNMVLRIEELLKTKEVYFIIVGVSHLIGKEGIVELLKQKGYSPRQL